MPMIQAKMNNGYIMYFPLYAVVARTFISAVQCSHLLQNVNDPDTARTFFLPTVLKLVSQKKMRVTLLFVRMRVIRARGPPFASSRATALIADSLASNRVTVSNSFS